MDNQIKELLQQIENVTNIFNWLNGSRTQQENGTFTFVLPPDTFTDLQGKLAQEWQKLYQMSLQIQRSQQYGLMADQQKEQS